MRRPFSEKSSGTSRERPIRVVRVVVVEVTRVVHIPDVVRVGAIRRTQPHVNGTTYSLHPYVNVTENRNA